MKGQHRDGDGDGDGVGLGAGRIGRWGWGEWKATWKRMYAEGWDGVGVELVGCMCGGVGWRRSNGWMAKEPDGWTAKEPDGYTAKEPDGWTARA